MRVIGLVILLVGLVIVATVQWALYGAPLMAAGIGILVLERYLQKRQMNKPGAPRFVPVHARGTKPVPKRSAPQRAAAKTEPTLKTAAREPVLDGGFVPIFEGEESSALFSDLRNQISAPAKDALTAMRNSGFEIRARSDRVIVSRDNHSEVLRSNAAITNYLRQLGLSGE